MKVELSSTELAVLMEPAKQAQAEVIRLNAEVARLNTQMAVMKYPHTDTGIAHIETKESILNALANVCEQLADGNKIGAIKIVRQLTGIGLKEAKDVVEGNFSGPGYRKLA